MSVEWTVGGQDKLRMAEKLYHTAVAYAAQREFPASHRVLADSLRMRKSVLFPSHPVVIATLDFQACLFGLQGDYFRQKEKLKEIIELMTDRYGEYHPEVTNALEQLYMVLKKCGEDVEAERISQTIWMKRATVNCQETSARDLEYQLEHLRLGQSLKQRIDASTAAFPGLRVHNAEPRVSQFLDPEWDPLKELEQARLRKKDPTAVIPGTFASLSKKAAEQEELRLKEIAAKNAAEEERLKRKQLEAELGSSLPPLGSSAPGNDSMSGSPLASPSSPPPPPPEGSPDSESLAGSPPPPPPPPPEDEDETSPSPPAGSPGSPSPGSPMAR